MEITPVKYGESTLPERMVFINGMEGKVRDIVFMVYLVKTDDKLILVDAGCETMPGFIMEDFIGPVKTLQDIGISAASITDVVITHSHHDHIECVKYFKNATIHIEENEYELGKSYIPDGFKVNVFREHFSLCDGVEFVKIGGHSHGSCIVEIEKDGELFVITGDECYIRECLTKKIPTGSSVNPDASAAFIKKYSDEKYKVLLCHDE